MSENGMTPAVMDHFLNPRNADDITVVNGMPSVPRRVTSRKPPVFR